MLEWLQDSPHYKIDSSHRYKSQYVPHLAGLIHNEKKKKKNGDE